MISARYFLLALVSFFLCYVVFKKKMAGRKIQPAFPKISDYTRDILYSISSMIIFSTMAYLVLNVLRPYNHFIYGSLAQLKWWQHGLSFIWLFFLHDFYFYCIHRLMHHPYLFKNVHLIHHKSTNPSPWTAYAFHPLEAVLEAGIIIVAGFTIPVHATSFAIFMVFQILFNIYGHLGYELFPRTMLNTYLGKWINTSVAHNQHHKLFKGNFGLYTLIWDRILGTVRKDYPEAMRNYGRKITDQV